MFCSFSYHYFKLQRTWPPGAVDETRTVRQEVKHVKLKDSFTIRFVTIIQDLENAVYDTYYRARNYLSHHYLACHRLPVVEMAQFSNVIVHGGTINSAQRDIHIIHQNNRHSEFGMS